jgi:hypothetical protein
VQVVVKVPYSNSFDAQAVKKQLGMSVSSWDEFMYRMKLLSERKVKSVEAERYFLPVFTDHNTKAVGQTTERAMTKALTLFGGQGKGVDLDLSKGAAFGLLNAATEFVDHERRARSIDYRLESACLVKAPQLSKRCLRTSIVDGCLESSY